MDPDPGGPKTYISDGSGSATLARTYLGHAVERVDGEHESLALDHSSLFSSKMGFHAKVPYSKFC